MSFQTVCSGCGAISSPSVGVCPFCKTVMSSGKGESGGVELVSRYFNDGRIESAITLGMELYRQKPELFDEPQAALVLAKVMIESEGPTSATRTVLVRANASHPGSSELTDYLEILEAKNLLREGPDTGEALLYALLRRTRDNVHANFVVGSHLYWVEEDANRAIPYLETCVRLRPNFLRAWACLGALYKHLGNSQLSRNAFQRCIALESNPTMKEFFEEQL